MIGRRRAGMALLEVLAYVVILGMVLNVAGQALITCTRLSAFGAAAPDRLVNAAEVEDAFRTAVRNACAVAPAVGDYRSGPETLVLEAPAAEGRRFQVLGCIGRPDRVTLLELVERDGRLEAESARTLAFEAGALRFAYSTPDPTTARLVTLQLTPKNVPGRRAAPEPRRVSAALGAIGGRP